MIRVEPLSAADAESLNNERGASYWAIPVALALAMLPFAAIAKWAFDVPWRLYAVLCGGVFGLFALGRIIAGKPVPLAEGQEKIVRRGKVLDARRKGNAPGLGRLNLNQSVEITLAPAETETAYPERNVFDVYRTLGMPYYKQDRTIGRRLPALIGTEVEIEYLAQTGDVLAFRELDPRGNPPKVYVRFGTIQLSSQRAVLRQADIIAISMAVNDSGCAEIALRTQQDELWVPLYATNLAALENWMHSLPDFSPAHYDEAKASPPASEERIWERKESGADAYHPVLASERVFFAWGRVYVDHGNDYVEDIRIRDIDYITINSYDAASPRARVQVSLRSFAQAGISASSRSAGFKKLEQWMAQLAGFDADGYPGLKREVGEEAVVIWQRDPVATAQLTSRSGEPVAPDMMDDGIFLANYQARLAWGTFGELKRMLAKPWMSVKRTRFPNPSARGFSYTIKKPVILGGLAIDALHADTPSWMDGGELNLQWPVTGYWANVSFGGGGLRDFEQLRQHLSEIFGPATEQSDPAVDGDTTIWAAWARGRVKVRISTWKPYQFNTYMHGCRLSIDYEAEVSHLYTDAYTRGLERHEQLSWLPLGGDLRVQQDYTHNRFARYTPATLQPLLLNGEGWLVWLDTREGKLGLGNADYAQIFDLEAISRLLLIGNYWRDSPADLGIHVVYKQKGRTAEIFVGNLQVPDPEQAWPTVQRQLENFLPFPCTYAEDRQYY